MPDETDPEATDDPTIEPGSESTSPDVDPSAAGATPADDVTTTMGAVGADDATTTMDAVEADDDATTTMAAVGAGATGEATATNVAAAESAESSDGGARHAKSSSLSRTWVIAIVAVVVLLAGAGIALGVSSGKSAKPKPPSHPHSSAATMIPATTPVGPTCPLTGAPAPGGQVPQRPALAYKVDNYPAARPQSGVTAADIVFEEPVEGGITRLVVVFQCQGANLVGPIRSARAIDVPILDQLSKPLFVHAGGINPVIALVQNGNLINDDVFTHAGIVQHVSGREAPYNTYASTAAVWGLNPTDTSPPAPLFTYSATAPTGTPTSSVHIPFSGTNDNVWSWAPITGQWQLSIGGSPANVADGGGRISVSNVIIQTVHITYGPWLENSEGGLEVQANLTGSGPLQVFRNGEEISGTWQRSALTDPTRLVAADGSTIALQPGKTWIELVPSTIPVTTKAASSATP